MLGSIIIIFPLCQWLGRAGNKIYDRDDHDIVQEGDESEETDDPSNQTPTPKNADSSAVIDAEDDDEVMLVSTRTDGYETVEDIVLGWMRTAVSRSSLTYKIIVK